MKLKNLCVFVRQILATSTTKQSGGDFADSFHEEDLISESDEEEKPPENEDHGPGKAPGESEGGVRYCVIHSESIVFIVLILDINFINQTIKIFNSI